MDQLKDLINILDKATLNEVIEVHIKRAAQENTLNAYWVCNNLKWICVNGRKEI